MKACKEETCQSNRDGICLGNWDECSAQKANRKFSLWAMCLILATILIVGLFVYSNNMMKQEAAAEMPPQEPERQIWTGQYTIFQYTQNGWSNHFYVTSFYVEDDILYYKLRDHQDEYMLMKFDDFLPVPGWIEDTDGLMQYGFWEPMESDW